LLPDSSLMFSSLFIEPVFNFRPEAFFFISGKAARLDLIITIQNESHRRGVIRSADPVDQPADVIRIAPSDRQIKISSATSSSPSSRAVPPVITSPEFNDFS